jgi:cobyrinic acid a,c-diamide synthase
LKPGCPAQRTKKLSLIIAAPRSGSGKTTVTLALAAAFRRQGLAVAVAKSGPDYIDPAFHAAATGHPAFNLDSWAMPPAVLDGLLTEAAEDADLVLIEASMGLFDGVGAPGRAGRAADLAARWGLPVLLVLDVSGQSQTAAATARGFIGFEPGSLLRDAALALPERHLGLVQAEETSDLATRIEHLAELAEARFDLDAILSLATPIKADGKAMPAIQPPGQRIAVARDAAFSFLYPHLLAGWRQAGAEIATFSPLADEPPPDACDACWLPGGYPELHGAELALARRFRTGLRLFAETRPVHGECGGYMVLGRALTDAKGIRHPMLGLLDHETSFARRQLHLGYRRAELIADGPLGRAGSALRGHEFHYATVSAAGLDAPFARLADAHGTLLGPAGSRRGRVTGSFFHLIAQEDRSS